VRILTTILMCRQLTANADTVDGATSSQLVHFIVFSITSTYSL